MKLKKCLKMKKKLSNQIKYWRLFKKILDFNKEIQKQGLGLKVLTPDQILRRLPISLAQLNAENNSEKMKNEIRQLLNSLYRSKKLAKNIYKSLFDIVGIKDWTLKIMDHVNHIDLN